MILVHFEEANLVRFLSISAIAMVLSTPAFADVDDLSGQYRAMFKNLSGEVVGSSCILQLDAPSRPPEYSRVQSERVSGFVLALPNCGHGLVTASLWQYNTQTETLRLSNRSGRWVFNGQRNEDGNFVDETSDGIVIEISKP